MQDRPLLISSILRHAARHHAGAEVVSKTVEGEIHRSAYPEIERRAKRLARALRRLGVGQHDRVGTLAWNGYRHLEIYYAASGMGAVCHTINPRLAPADINYIIEDAADRVLFADTSFAALVEGLLPTVRGTVRAVVFLCDRARMPALAGPPGVDVLCYEELIDGSDEGYDWPEFDERTASSLCYTSGTTGRPKGVLYSHRSTLLHAYAVNTADAFGLRAVDRMMPVVPMFHVNAWGAPYAAPMAGASLVMPGRHLDGASLAELMNAERVTVASGVPTIWLGLLQHLRTSGQRLETVRKIATGGAAAPPLLFEAFGREYGVRVDHAWGMTEVSPVGTYGRPKPGQDAMPEPARVRQERSQGRALFGVDLKIVDDEGRELPWDGVAFGNLLVRGPWVCSGYFNGAGDGSDAEGWFATGDVATIDPDGFVEITDRSKDVIKSGGEWISSIALENIAVSHPDVAEAAIVAARHPKWSERPLLLLVPKEGRTVPTAEVLAMFEGQVPRWWMPDDAVVVPALPHTATGKVHKLVLRERFRDHYAAAEG